MEGRIVVGMVADVLHHAAFDYLFDGLRVVNILKRIGCKDN